MTRKNTLSKKAAKILISKKKTISCAESCTGGLLTKKLTDISGSSNYLIGSVISYSNKSKNKILKIPNLILKKHGAVSSEVAKLMALNIRKITNSDIGVSITGIAGPKGGNKEKPVGLVYFGFSTKKNIKIEKKMFNKNFDREKIRELASDFVLEWIVNDLPT